MGPYENMIITGIDKNISISENITVYPNPATDNLYFTGVKNTIGKIKIIDGSGKIVQETNLSNYISTKEITKGVYLIVIETETNIISKKLVID